MQNAILLILLSQINFLICDEVHWWKSIQKVRYVVGIIHNIIIRTSRSVEKRWRQTAVTNTQWSSGEDIQSYRRVGHWIARDQIPSGHKRESCQNVQRYLPWSSRVSKWYVMYLQKCWITTVKQTYTFYCNTKRLHFPLKIFLHFSTAKLNLDFKSFYTGWYWIDPNLGVPTDAIQVWCNVTSKGETCVYPDDKSRMVTFQFVLVSLLWIFYHRLM